MTQALIVSHTDAHTFRVMRLPDGKSGQAVTLTPPDALAVEGRHDSHLLPLPAMEVRSTRRVVPGRRRRVRMAVVAKGPEVP